MDVGKYYLVYVYLLIYRVEILENIFSFLFIIYEDFYEGRIYYNESDDVEVMDEEIRSLFKSSWIGSWESFVSFLDLLFDVYGLYIFVKD